MAARMTAPTPATNARPVAVPPIPDEDLLSVPIPDGNGNGVLDGQDIVRKLIAEQAELAKGNPKQAAHAIMAGIDTNGLADKLAISIRTKKSCDPKELGLIAAEIGDKLLKYIDFYGSRYDAARRSEAIALTQKASLDKGEGKADAELSLYQVISRMNFAQSYHSHFYQIAIKPHEVVPILEIFAEKPDDLKACRAPQRPAVLR